jgi:hypothetical protein
MNIFIFLHYFHSLNNNYYNIKFIYFKNYILFQIINYYNEKRGLQLNFYLKLKKSNYEI